MTRRRFAAALLVSMLAALLPAAVSAQQSGFPPFSPGSRMEIVQRFNFTVRTNGRYDGHVQRETRLFLTGGAPAELAGEFMATENTVRDLRTVASRVRTRVPVRMRAAAGALLLVSGEPVSQGIPTISERMLEADGPWQAPAVLRVQAPDGTVYTLPTMVAYQPRGAEMYNGRRVLRIEFGYSLSWPMNRTAIQEHPAAEMFDSANFPPPGMRIRANHQGVILMPADQTVPVLHRTNIQEQFVEGADTETRRGFVLTWYSGGLAVSPSPGPGRVAGTDAPSEAGSDPGSDPEPDAGVAQSLEELVIPDVAIDRDELDRVRLSLRNLQFVADQATLLPGERARLDSLAEALKEVPRATILVTGHTADVGTAESQFELSVRRAETIVEELVSRGVRAGRMRYEGRGGTEPVGDNTTEAGRAANRRVEIRLLTGASR